MSDPCDDRPRCHWPGSDPLYCAYHDEEWGAPERDPRALWEKLILDGFQAGLAWITVLRKRETMRAAFNQFEPEIIARYGEADVDRLMNDVGIIRSKAKIWAAISNAQIYLDMDAKGVDFADVLWGFVNDKPIQNAWPSRGQVPVTSPEAEAMSKALKKLGFKFVGPVIVYAFMQAVGMVNDHTTDCFRHSECQKLA